MLKEWRVGIQLLLLFGLTWGCTPSVPAVTAPADVPVWQTFQDLPPTLQQELKGKRIQYVTHRIDMQLYDNLFVDPSTGEIGALSVPLLIGVQPSGSRFSRDGRYYVYTRQIGPPDVRIIDLETGKQRVLLKMEDITNVQAFWGAAISPDNRYVIVTVVGDDLLDLVRVDLQDGKFRRLFVTAPIAPETVDIAPDGMMVALCHYNAGHSAQLGLCLLDKEGQMLRELTPRSRFGSHLSAGRFTPDGMWVIYDREHRLYKVHRDGSHETQIAPCTVNGPAWVTATYALTACYVSIEPECYEMFAAALDGEAFWRLGYIEKICVDADGSRKDN